MDLWTSGVAGIMVLVVLVLSSSFRAAGEEVCDAALVSSLPPSSFRSSSQLSGSHAPSFAKLNRRDGAGGWSPLASDRYQWLEADLGERTKVTAVATQGRYGSSDWLTSYLLMFSDTGHNWKQYRQEDSLGSFPGNSNADSVVQYKLQQPVVARFLRLIPLGWNPNGRIGLRLEAYGCPYTSDVASLDGGSSLTYSPSPALKRTFRDVVTLKFKTVRNSGMLLHAGGAGGLGLSLELERGKLQLLLRQGQASSAEPRRLASLGSLLDDQHWHRVAVERRGAHLNVTVDKHTEKVRVPAEFGHWDVQQLNVGGGPGLGPETPGRSGRNFHGCLENLLYNGHSLIDLVKQKSRQVAVAGNVTFSCDEPLSVAVTFPGPQSFLQLPGVPASSSGSFSVGFQFRTWNRAGLLLTFALPQEGGVVWLYLSEARLRLQIHKAGRVLLELSAGWALNDGQWHQAELKSRRGRLSIVVDKEERSSAHASHSLPVAIESSIFFGGCPTEGDVQGCRNPFHVFQGCMSLLTLDDQKVNLILVQQKQLGTYGNLQLDMCGVIDRCSPSPCEHGGRCTQSWTGFHCNCSDSGYSGATCHSSAYERSCEAYKHAGSTSGHFYIDVDGSGPIGPQLVYCNMTEGNTWMEVPHNNTELTRVRAAPGANQRSVYFDYAAGEEQLAAAIGQSEHCQQELSYHCRKSRLLNTPEGSPFSWWVGGPGPGRVQTYWGGAQPGSQQCACGLQGDCVDPQHYCNCDADRAEWAQDSGPLAHKESLPVRSLLLGDIQRPGSEAAYRVGPLRCHGDRNFWNAAFFDRETSYLHFPTFHGELSADISFLFKTTASSGVFLENLGIKDFIRIELSSSSQVLFSFDVGNGPLEVRVDSSVPLNDNRWHRVRAERNIKEASLQLDDLPAATQEAPAEGHFHLQLNSQLFIGGTASRQKGFRGCIRSLQLNGVTLDLEERASITPGVQPGCPGHCSSYGSFCQNHGRCVERVNGFHCDCGLSAHAGVFCHTEVSASFKPATSVSYTFKEPYEQVRNSSAVPSSIYTDVTLRGENVTLSFRTFQSPAVLFYVSSYHREFLAVLINKHDKLEVRYKLDSSRDAEVMRSRVRHLANGRLHSVSVRRLSESVSVQIDQNPREDFNLTSDGEFNAIKSLVLGKVHGSDDLDPDLLRLGSLGFAGCLSVVRFNSISPLKAALLHPDTSPVTITGPLLRSGCGSASANPSATEDTHLLTGVIAVAIFLMVAGLAIAGRFLYRRKETYRNQEVKGVKQEDGPDFPFSSQAESQDASEENPKEYFI
ncbi:contactin-associated protein-like 4 isoform X2 [Takifugu rubripes]|uniref:contactin-associated protein-like 4 isoform X2 n=1 Tax=Takifugu rubripes TaxID=31033 RepID=UPI0011458346|nr:contactin-associated protein-like 4 isoform X2 [Takifugu rubripes]